jgi:D-3-phosphoglycerate dehydrogenase
MPHILVAGRIHQAGIALLKSTQDVTVDIVEDVSVESYTPLVGDADAILIRTQPMPASVVESAKRLQIVSRHGVGYDAIDVQALSQRGIPLAIVGDVNSRSVAEHTMMFMLTAARRMIAYDAATRHSEWKYRDSLDAMELAGKTLLIIGFGRIGQTVARLAAAFGMKIMAHDPFIDESSIGNAGALPAPDLDTALPLADVISLHIPKSPGRAIISAQEIARMKPSAIVINTARGGLIDEQALDTALRDGRLGCAALDVFTVEPPPADHPLLTNHRIVLSPHSAGLTEECAERMAVAAVRNILDFFAGKIDAALVVNRDHVSSLAIARPAAKPP